jgi:hypothetical protein
MASNAPESFLSRAFSQAEYWAIVWMMIAEYFRFRPKPFISIGNKGGFL